MFSAGSWIKVLSARFMLLCLCAFCNLAMEPVYTPAALKLFRCHTPLDPTLYKLCRSLGITRRPRYAHRFRKGPTLIYGHDAQIPTVYTPDRRRPQPRNRGINFDNLRRPPRLPPPALSSRQNFNIGHLNARSITNKTALINDLITDKKCDLFCLSETWQQPGDCINLNLLTPPLYLSKPRSVGRGGGLAVVYRSDLTIKELRPFEVTSFEYIAVKVVSTLPLLLLLIYRPPKPSANFLSELNELLTVISSLCSAKIMLGDFNIHVDTNCSYTSEFNSVLDCFSLTQHVDFPTHTYGHTLDLLCSSGLNDISVSGSISGVSDHKLIVCRFHMISPPPSSEKTTITGRNIRSIDHSMLAASIQASPLSDLDELSSADNLVAMYNDTLTSLLDSLAPVRTRLVPANRTCPWFTPELGQLKAAGRRLEQLYKKTGLTIHSMLYTEHIQTYRDALNAARSNYYSSLITSSVSRPKTLFSKTPCHCLS